MSPLANRYRVVVILCGVLFLAAAKPNHTAQLLAVPEWSGALKVDGNLDELCYRSALPLTNFVVAGQPGKQPPRTRAWLFWNVERLLFAFECEDDKIIAAPPSKDERDVDGQDRVEIFFWSGRTADSYACFEIGARGAVHDYQARFYRKFDSAWKPEGWTYATSLTAKGYRVEGEISRRAMKQLGFDLKPGARIRAGLFRADFSSIRADEEPLWITWVDAAGPKPDFHVAESFREIVLQNSAGDARVPN